jgi:hypothetical protein
VAVRTASAGFVLLGALIATTAATAEAVLATDDLAASGGGTSATWRTLAFFGAIATVMTLTVVIASTSTSVVRRTRRDGRS